MRLDLQKLGLIDYQEALELQLKLQQDVIKGNSFGHLLLCSHPTVITYGKTADLSDIKITESELQQRGIQVLETGRGGKVTLHNPGQLILYPIINLKNFKTDVDWYLRKLELVIIKMLEGFELSATTICEKTGVWLPAKNNLPERKIASIGVRFSRWVSMHGLALNIYGSDEFNLITPCGLSDAVMTDLQKEIVPEDINVAYKKSENLLIENFYREFALEANHLS